MSAVEPYDVRNYGARCDGTTDDTNAIQSALTANPVALIPIGMTCNVRGIVAIGERRTLLLGGSLQRISGGATTPVVVLQAHHAVLHGLTGTNSTITSNYNSPDGVVCVGQFTDGARLSSRSGLAMIEPEVSNLRIVGNKNSASKGLVLQSMQAYSDTSTLYDGHFSNLHIRDVGIGIYLNSQANAHNFDNITLRNISQYALQLLGTSEGNAQTNSDNNFANIFVDSSAGLAACVFGRGVLHTNLINVSGEPGSGKLLDMSGGTIFVAGVDNCPDASSWSVSQGVLLLNGSMSATALTTGAVVASTIVATQLNATNATFGSGSMTAGPSVSKNVAAGGTAAVDIDFSGTGFCTVEIAIAHTRNTTLQAHYFYERISCDDGHAAGGATSIQQLYNQSAGPFQTAVADFALSRPTAGRVRITYTCSRSGANTITAFARGSRIRGMTIT